MIEAYIPKREDIGLIAEGLYGFNSQKRLHWLQRACLAILEKLGCQKYRMETEVNMVSIDLQNVARMLVKSQHAIKDVYRMKAEYVVLGHRQMMDLQMEELGPAIVNLPGDFGNRIRPSFSHQLSLITIPWLDDGILVLPDLDQLPAIGTSW